ncbi:MAG: NlpC/P60 family protein [Bacteroidota bacterium]|nr:NlpC/P60 family protein [Bacteroidota bacterium]
MKNVITFFALLLCSATGNVKSQTSYQNFKENIVALNTLTDISFIPQENLKTLFHTAADPLAAPASESGLEKADVIEKFSATQFKYAMMMDVDMESLTNPLLYNFIDEWFGTHYRMGGTTKRGIDCSAFTGLLLASVYSFAMPRTAREQYNICEHIDKENLMSGDLVFFNTRGGVSHVGVYLTDGHFVHSSSSDGVKISSLNDCYYSRKFIGGGRVNQ